MMNSEQTHFFSSPTKRPKVHAASNNGSNIFAGNNEEIWDGWAPLDLPSFSTVGASSSAAEKEGTMGSTALSQVSMSPSTPGAFSRPQNHNADMECENIDFDDEHQDSNLISQSDADATQNSQDSAEDPLLDLTCAPEIGTLTQNMKQLALDESVKGDEAQEEAISLATQGKNLFLTGRAGTGKSWVTRRIVHFLNNSGKTVHVTAPTGMAAINVDGTTIHRWGGFGKGDHYADFDRMMDKKIKKKIRSTNTLLIDEISMLSGHLYDVLECMVSIIRCYDDLKERLKDIKDKGPVISVDEGGRRKEREVKSIMSLYMLQMRWVDPGKGGLADVAPWGGMQLIVIGDFFQLPPVPNDKRSATKRGSLIMENEELIEIEYNLKVGRQGCYAFQSYAWSKSNLNTVVLTKVHRQSSDDGLLDLLNAMREGQKFTMQHRKAISAVRAPLPERSDGIIPTKLCPLNKDVDAINRRELEKLPDRMRYFKATDEIELDYYYKQKLLTKYNLQKEAHMPFLWACVEPLPPPLRLLEAEREIKALDQEKPKLLAEEKYEELSKMRDRKKVLEKEVSDMKQEEERKSAITLSSIAEWQRQENTTSSQLGTQQSQTDSTELTQKTEKHSEAPEYIMQKLQAFQKQLKEDFANLSKHADQRFFNSDCQVNQELELKRGAQVMLRWNIDFHEKLVNGSRGVVLGFIPVALYLSITKAEIAKRTAGDDTNSDDKEEEKVVENKVPHVASSSQHSPIKDADHSKEEEKSSSKSESIVPNKLSSLQRSLAPENSDSNEYECTNSGKNSTHADLEALLQKSGLDQLFLKEICNAVAKRSSDDIIKEQDSLNKSCNILEIPLVRFDEGQTRVIVPMPFRKIFRGCGTATRWQIPMTLAWSISIHKSQGMTIDWLRIDLKGCFSPGQAYVACSRGRSTDKMTVENFSESEVKASDIVKHFYGALNGTSTFTPDKWIDSLAHFEKTAASESRLQGAMEREHGNQKCNMCGGNCSVKMAKNSKNRGKWYIRCDFKNTRSDGHTFKWVHVVRL